MKSNMLSMKWCCDQCARAFFTLFLVALPWVTWAQSDKSSQRSSGEMGSGWYVGTPLGSLMGRSDFSSFAVDKFRPGWNAGIFGGYHCNTVLSVEAFAQWGKALLAEQACCIDRNYWLNTEEWRRSVLENGSGAHYSNLLSENFIQRYGVQFNINLLGFFHPDRLGRLRIELAPSFSAVGSSTDLKYKDGDAIVATDINKWHLGVGSNAQVSYAVTRNLDLGLYAGVSFLTGKNFDAMPKIHSDNYLYDAGIRLTWNFRKTDKVKEPSSEIVEVAPEDVETVAVESTPTDESQSITETVEVVDTQSEPEVIETVDSESLVDATIATDVKVEDKATEPIVEQADSSSSLNALFSQNIIFFSFNSVWIEPSERDKVKEIARIMKAHPSIRVRVTGWGDSRGTEQQNLRVSLQRAEAVKRVLGQWLIPSDRVEVLGGGIKPDAPTDAQARCAITIEIVE